MDEEEITLLAEEWVSTAGPCAGKAAATRAFKGMIGRPSEHRREYALFMRAALPALKEHQQALREAKKVSKPDRRRGAMHPERNRQFAEMYQAGMTQLEIGKQFGLSDVTVSALLRKYEAVERIICYVPYREDSMVGVHEAARIKQVNVQTIYKYIATFPTATKQEGRWMVQVADLVAWKARLRNGGWSASP